MYRSIHDVKATQLGKLNILIVVVMTGTYKISALPLVCTLDLKDYWIKLPENIQVHLHFTFKLSDSILARLLHIRDHEGFSCYFLFICILHFAGADTVRFKAEINFDGREITRRHLSRKETAQLLQVRRMDREVDKECSGKIIKGAWLNCQRPASMTSHSDVVDP
jgi:hypothetical protein